jgi:hypothetical protein
MKEFPDLLEEKLYALPLIFTVSKEISMLLKVTNIG